MEKICIVKRRQQSTQNEVNAIIKNDHTVNINSEEAQNDIILSNKNLPEKKIVEEYNDESGHFISITMTNEQSSVLPKLRKQPNWKVNGYLPWPSPA